MQKKNSIKILALAALALSLGACGGGGKGDTSSTTSTSESTASSTYQSTGETSSEASQSQEESTAVSESTTVSESVSESQPVSESQSQEQSESETTAVSESISESESTTVSESESESESSSEEQPATLYGLGEILSLDAESQWEHLGEKVIVKDLVCQGLWDEGKTLVGGGALGESITTLRGLEIHATEAPVFEHGSGWAALFDVEGTLIDVNGRAVIDDAVVTVTSERTSAGGGGSVYYWPAQYMNRGNWDQYLGRVMSGAMLEGVFQIASKPEVISQEQGTTFEVVFPGENLDVDDLDNYSLIEVQVPDGMSESGVKAFNEYFAEKEVGQFFTYFGSGQYDLINNIGYGLVIDSFGAQFLEDPEEEPEIFNTWDDVAAAAGKYFNDPLPALGDDRVFSYTYEFGGAATDVILEEYVLLTDKENANCVTINYNYKPADAEQIVDDFVAKLETLGWEEQTGDLKGVFLLSEEENCIGELIIDADSETGLSYYYMAAKPVIDPNVQKFASLAELKDAYNTRVATHFEGFETKLLFVPAAEEYVLDLTYETYNLDEYEDEIYDYTFYFNFEEGYQFPEDAFGAYLEALANEGFEEKLLLDYEYTGLYNGESREFIVFCANGGDKIGMEVYVLSEADAAKYVTDVPEATFDNYDALKALYEQRAGAFIENFATAIPDPQANLYHLDWSDETYCYDSWEDEIYTYEMSFYFEDGIAAEAAGAWAEVLKGNDFVEKRLADYTIDGLFNPNTNEFVYGIAVDEEAKTLTFNVRVLTDAMVAAYIIDIPDLLTFDQINDAVSAALSAEITAITGTETEYAMSFAGLLNNENYAGFTYTYASEGGFAKYYSSYGLITQHVVDATLAGGAVAATVVGELVDGLLDAGFVGGATFQLFQGVTGYFNATTNEFVMIQYTDTLVRIQLFVLDATSAAFVQIAA